MKKICLVVILIILSLLSTTRVKAQIVINELSSASNPEWVEIYNMGLENLSLKDYSLNFGTESQTRNFCDNDSIEAKAYKIINTSRWLADDGDVVTLRSGDDIVDTIGYGSGYPLGKIAASASIGRSPDGSGNWVVLSVPSPSGGIVSFDCPDSTAPATPTSTPSVYKSVYKINKSKDSTGSELKSVQIYVDGVYIHHEDDEIVEFFDGHECYSEVNCNLGIHTISLRKSGYLSWEDTQNFTAGTNIEVNPILQKEEASTPVPTPTKTSTPKPAPTKTPVPTILAAADASESASTASGVLGLKIDNFESGPSKQIPEDEKNKPPILAILLILGGLCFIAIPISSIIKNGKKNLETS